MQNIQGEVRHRYLPSTQPNRVKLRLCYLQNMEKRSGVDKKLMHAVLGVEGRGGLIPTSLASVKGRLDAFDTEDRWPKPVEEPVINAIAECTDNIYNLFLGAHSQKVSEVQTFHTLGEVSPMTFGRMMVHIALSTTQNGNASNQHDLVGKLTAEEEFYRAVVWSFFSLISPIDFVKKYNHPDYNFTNEKGDLASGPIENFGKHVAIVQKETLKMGALLQLWVDSRLFHTLEEITDLMVHNPRELSFLYHFSKLLREEIRLFYAVTKDEVSTSHLHAFLRNLEQSIKPETEQMMRRSFHTQQKKMYLPHWNDLEDIIGELMHCRMTLMEHPELKDNFLNVSKEIYDALPRDETFYKIFLLSLFNTQQDIERHEPLVASFMQDDPSVSLVLQKALERGDIEKKRKPEVPQPDNAEGFDAAFDKLQKG